MDSQFMTVRQVGDYLGLATITIYRLAEKKGLPGVKAGGKWRFIKSEVDQWLKWRKR